jgi:hypothetical protein
MRNHVLADGALMGTYQHQGKTQAQGMTAPGT